MKLRWKVRYRKAEEDETQAKESKPYKNFHTAYKVAQLYREAGMHAEILSVEVP